MAAEGGPPPQVGSAQFWRWALDEFGEDVGVPKATLRMLSDDQVEQLGRTLAIAFLGPIADLLGPLVFRAVQAYREAEHEAKYQHSDAEPS